MKYKHIIKMTDYEIKSLIKELLDIDIIHKIDRDSDKMCIYIEASTFWDIDDEPTEIKDGIILDIDSIDVPWGENGLQWKYQQYLMAKGYHPLWEDNKYITR